MTNFQIPTLKKLFVRRKDFLLGTVVFLGALALYWRTLAPSVATIFDDSLEFQVVCPTLGIAHPTGYPLYTLLGKFFTLIPIGDAAYRVNLMSAFFAALTVVVIYLIVRILTDGSLAALFASLAIAVSPVFWSQAVIAEVYSLNAFFTALVVYLLFRWEMNRRQRPDGAALNAIVQVDVQNEPESTLGTVIASRSPERSEGAAKQSPRHNGRQRWRLLRHSAPRNDTSERLPFDHLLLVAFVYGLSLTHHRLMLLLAPAMALTVWLTERRTFANLKLISRLTLLFLAPFLLYAYIPLRGMYTSSLDGTYQNTWSGFLRYVTASGYNVFITGNPLAQSRPLSFYGQLLVSQFGLVGVGLGLVGLLASTEDLARQWSSRTCSAPTERETSFATPEENSSACSTLGRSRASILLGVAFALNAAFVLTYRVADIEVFAIPVFLLYAIWIGVGVDFLLNLTTRLAKKILPQADTKVLASCRLLVAVLFLLQPLALLRDNYPELDLSQRWAVHDYGVDMLSQPLEDNAVIIGILGEVTLLRYFQRMEGLRPEVATIVADRDEKRLATLEGALGAGQAVYVTRPVHGLPERYSLSALGPLIRVRATPAIAIPAPQYPLVAELVDSLRLLGYDVAVMSPHQQTTVRLTLHWQVLAPVGADYKVSARLLDVEGNQVAQVDDVPVHNTYPTSRWKAGETIADVYDLAVPSDTPSGPYRLLVILYDPDTLAEVGRTELGTVQL
jgi:hypothetical protein